MQVNRFEFNYEAYNSAAELPAKDRALLQQAKEALSLAYVPYSHFSVGAAALLNNGEIYKSANQENASYPVTICAERALLGTISSLQPGIAVKAIAITYKNDLKESHMPISPCGMCRQALLEYEQRFRQEMRIILGGTEGPVYIITGCSNLLPFSFTADYLA